MKYNFAIVEDEESDYKSIIDFLEKHSKDSDYSFEAFHFSSFESFLFARKDRKYDLIFMDIMMNGINGFDGAKKLRELQDDTPLVFVTTVARMASNGYEVDALSFMIKPLEYPSFALKMNRIISKIRKTSSQKITIKNKDEIVTIDEKDIIYVEVKDHVLIYHTANETYRTYGSMKNAMTVLSDKMFFKCNSCYLVNMSYINGIKGYSLFINGEELLISHPQKPKFLKAYQSFVQES